MFPNGNLFLAFGSGANKIPEREFTSAMTSIDSAQSLGTALKNARKRMGLTQSDLALAAGVGLRFIVELEGGKPTVRLAQVLRVIDALGASLMLAGLQADGTPDRKARDGS
jgi:HTH-type transcriptional regulator / antitoxin HipB